MIRYSNLAPVFSDTAVGGGIRSLFSIKCFWVLVYSGVAQVYITANWLKISEIPNVKCSMQASQVTDIGFDPVSVRLLGEHLVHKLSTVYSTYDAPFCK